MKHSIRCEQGYEVFIEAVDAMSVEKIDNFYDPQNYSDEEINAKLMITISHGYIQTSKILYTGIIGDLESLTLVIGNQLYIGAVDTVYRLDLHTLKLCFEEYELLGSIFGLYKVNDGIIVHSEISILKLNYNLEEIWSFMGKDIFATISNKKPFNLLKDRIELYDFNDEYYAIDLDGNLITR